MCIIRYFLFLYFLLNLNSRNFTNKSKCRDNFKVCCKISSIKKGNRLANKPHKCGYYNKSGTFPWSGKLYYLEKKQGRLVYTYKCEFSLIHQQVGLTAAHCLDDEYYLQPEKYIINIGKYLLEKFFFFLLY